MAGGLVSMLVGEKMKAYLVRTDYRARLDPVSPSRCETTRVEREGKM